MSWEQLDLTPQETANNGLDLWATLFAAVMSGILGTLCVFLSVSVAGSYGSTLFVGLPVIVGAIATLVYSYKAPLTSYWQATKLSVVAGGMLCSSLLLMGSEGLLCILMALPLCLPLTMLGGILGYALLHAIARRVFIILFENALYALSRCENHICRVCMEKDGTGVTIAVEDSGPGIPDALRDRVFEPFVTGRKREGKMEPTTSLPNRRTLMCC